MLTCEETLHVHIMKTLYSRLGNLKFLFISLISTCFLFVISLEVRYLMKELRWLCADSIHNKIYYSLWPIDYKPRGNVTQLRKIYREYLGIIETPTVDCLSRVHYGHKADGGWHLCDDVPYRIPSPCLIHSWGINYDFTFDDDVSSKRGCVVYSFDPSMGWRSYDRSEKVHFLNFGLKGTSLNQSPDWNLRTYEDTLTYLSQNGKTIDFIKLDIEGAEWEALSSSSMDKILRNVRQMALEVHVYHDATEDLLVGYVETLKRLRRIGFEIYASESNPCGQRLPWRNYFLGYSATCCHNVHFLNTKFIKPS